MSDTATSSASNDLSSRHHTHESHAFETPTCVRVAEDEKLRAASPLVQPAAVDDKSSSSEPKRERAPISWLRQAAAEIESKKRNPNPERTRHSNRRHRQTSDTSSPYAMSEGTSGKLQQNDYTPEVDELLPRATALAQVGSTATRSFAFPSLTVIAW